jgi:hypothetical protein
MNRARPASDPVLPAASMDPQLQRQLKALGYL